MQLMSSDPVENNRPWFAYRKSTRLRAKFLLLVEASGLGFHEAACKKEFQPDNDHAIWVVCSPLREAEIGQERTIKQSRTQKRGTLALRRAQM
jgi:hypothetical protein